MVIVFRVEFYSKAFKEVGGVVHTHSSYATSWAQAGRSIPCYGTTHADYFYGEIPCVRCLTKEEIEDAYEENTGHLIVNEFERMGKDPVAVPAVLCKNHGVFSWGKDAHEAVHNAVVTEEVAKMAYRCEVRVEFYSKATQDATEKMLDAGMQNILYLYNSNSYSGLKKLAGYQNALLTHDIPLKKELQQCFKGSHEDIDGVKNFVDHIYKKGIRFDGIVTSDDFLAVGAMNFARANNINVPGDLQIIGYNNSILTLCSEPDISSVDNRLEDMCIQLVKTLIGTLSQNEMPQKTIFSGELIKRGSTSF